jgi:hypothetical protein
MADRVVKILTPALTYDLISLAELKASMGIPDTDTSLDVQLQAYITQYSDVIATTCNRVFAYEECLETWRCTNYDDTNSMKRLFLSHYPIVEADVLSVESPTGSPLDPSGYAIEEKSGKIELFASVSEPITVHYSGGYDIPTATPPALKIACELLVREGQALFARLLASGIRSISHKDSRVMYFDPLTLLEKNVGIGFAAGAANNLLMHYVRIEV